MFLLDYDGTLRELCPTPAEAAPTAEIMELLRALAADPKNTVVVVSGRDAATLTVWLGDLPLHLIAEHGLAYRAPGGAWQSLSPASDASSWKSRVREYMNHSVTAAPGSFIEEKSASLAWHYRVADQADAEKAQAELLVALKSLTRQAGLRVLNGNKVIEIQPGNISKGKNTYQWLGSPKADFMLAAGDDVTDEDLFASLPSHAWTIKIGKQPSIARYRLESPAKLRAALSALGRQPKNQAHDS